MTEHQKCLSPKPHNYIPVAWGNEYHALKVPYDFGRLLSQRKSPNKFFRIYEFEKGLVVEACDVDWEFSCVQEYREGVRTTAQVSSMIKKWIDQWHKEDDYYSGKPEQMKLSLTLSPSKQDALNDYVTELIGKK